MAKVDRIPREVSNAELEFLEYTMDDQYKTRSVLGNKHNDSFTDSSGTPVILAENTKILSQYLKADKEIANNLVGKNKKMSFAEMGKMYNTIPDLITLNNPKEDDLAKKTAQLMLTKKVAQIESIFHAQETQKEQTSMKTLDELLNKVDSYKNGGEIPKYQLGSQIPMTYGTVGTKMNNFNPFARLRTQPIYTQKQLFTEEPMVQQNLFGQRLFNDPRVSSYQKKQIAWDKDKGYLNDPLSLATRRETVSHVFNDIDVNYKNGNMNKWKHIDIFDSNGKPIVKEGQKMVNSLPENGDFTFNMRTNALGETVPSFNDGDNYPDNSRTRNRGSQNQVPMYTKQGFDATPDDSPSNLAPLLPRNNTPINPLPLYKPNLPAIPRELLPVPKVGELPPTARPNPFDDAYNINQLRDIVDLATLDVKPPAYNYKPQNIAYQRFLPQNTLAAERQFNLQKQMLENSNAPEQVKLAMLNDLQGKFQDNVSEVQNRNYQGDLQNDNNNTQLYNTVTNQNRAERIQYDDNYRNKEDVTAFRASQEKLRLQDQLINNYDKRNKENQKLKLISDMGEGYYINNGEIQPIPGYKFRDISNPMSAFEQSQINDLWVKLRNAKDGKEAADYAKAISDLNKGR